jgi:septum formation protein
MEKKLNQTKLVLASSSPRRKELLLSSGISFLVLISDIEEKQKENESAKDYATRNAKEKALAVSSRLTASEIVLSADTIVITKEGHVLEKPMDKDHAFRMLSSLSNHEHLVYTAYSLFQNGNELITRLIETKVFFRKLSSEEILAYIATGEPFDKSGSYGIQGGAMGFVERIEGSYTNVMGLPLSHVLVDLELFAGIKIFQNEK